jgi:penicillin-binding protein-related factor A (putative recombinase)
MNNKNKGKNFENSFKKSVDETVAYYLRLQDAGSAFGDFKNEDKNSNLRFTIQNPYDCIIFYNCCLFCLELKHTENTSIAFDRDKKDKKQIKLHQIEGLAKASKHVGINAGFILDFAISNNTYYFDIKDFLRFYNSIDKKSINEKDVIEYRGLLIEKKLLRTNYRYDITKFLLELST